MSKNVIRSFIAIPLPQRIKQQLGQVQIQIRRQPGTTARFPQSNNLHLTLIFLGDIPIDRLYLVRSAMDNVSLEHPGFYLRLSALGIFPGGRRPPRVLWSGIEGDITTLNRIYKELNDELAFNGMVLKKMKFSPHITLARFKKPPQFHDIKNRIDLPGLKPSMFRVEEIHLYQSVLTPQGAEYSLLYTSSLR